MKKTIFLVLAAMLMMCSVTAFAAEATAETATVYVTISDGEGNLALAQEAITVTDADGDGALTVNDALHAAHEAKYEGGAAAGYGSEASEWGLSMTKLWGTENGGGYGYCVNHASAMSLVDPIADGDYMNAYVYTDMLAWSDTYCYFDLNTASVQEGEAVTLILSAAGYDESWNPITVPVEGAVITVDGVATEVVTDAEGKATIAVTADAIISATSESQTLVPPVCKVSVTVKETQPAPAPDNTQPEDNTGLIIGVGAVVLIAAVVIFVVIKRKKK